MSSNQALLRKADLALSDLTSAGKLNNEQALLFVRKLIDQPTILNGARTVSMNAPIVDINKIGFGSRIMKAATSATALGSSDRSKPTLSKLSLTANEVMAEVHLPYDVLEDNIESAGAANNEAMNAGPGGLRNTLISLIAERAALDLEELSLLGDTTSGDAYLAVQDGYLEDAKDNGNVYNHGSTAISKTLFKKGIKTLPTKYLRNKGAMVQYVSHDQETEYRDTLADRATALGDASITGATQAMAYGTRVVPVALMPEANGLFTNPLNLIFGIWRDISMEYDKDIRARVYIIVLTCRVAFKIEEPEAVVKYDNILTV